MKILRIILLSNLIVACSDRQDVEEVYEKQNLNKHVVSSVEQKNREAEAKRNEENLQDQIRRAHYSF